jgi:hypothetical protein
VSYTGTLTTAAAGHPLVVFAIQSGGFFGEAIATTIVSSTSNNGNYALNVPLSTTYTFGAYIATSNTPPCQDLSTIPQGAVVDIDSGSLAVNGNLTGTNFSFNDTVGQIPGISGGVTYLGSKGTVSTAHPIVILCYANPGYTTLDGSGDQTSITCNNTTYSCHIPSNPSDDILAFYDLTGTGLPASGDPYIELGQITPTTTLTQNISFDDTNLWP